MRTHGGLIALFVATAVGLGLAWSYRRAVAQPSPAAEAAATQLFRVEFGRSDREARDWSGEVRVRGCRLVALREWHFSGDDGLDGTTRWHCATRLVPAPPRRVWEGHLPQAPPTFISKPGLLVEVAGAGTVELETRAGRIEFDTGDAAIGLPERYLDGAVEVQPVPVTTRLTARGEEDDYPSLAVTRDGTEWVAWQSYRSGGEAVRARRGRGGSWSEPMAVTPSSGDIFRTAVAEDGQGRVWIVWSAREDDNWDLFGRAYTTEGWSAVQRLTQAAEVDAFHQLIADRDGRLWLVWQSWRGGRADIWARTLTGDRWSPELRVSPSPANDWEPAVAAAPDGTVYVAWDSYDQGNYDIFLRRLRAAPSGEPRLDGGPWPVAATTDFQAHASVAVDRAGRVWLAWDESGPNWGKDTGFMWEITGRERGTRLAKSRRPVLVQWTESGLQAPTPALSSLWPQNPYVWAELPRVAVDGAGKVWVVVRQRTLPRPSLRGIGRGHAWEHYAVTWEGDGWSRPIYLPDSLGRHDMRVALAAGAGSGVTAAWSTDERLWTNPAPVEHNVYTARLVLPESSDQPRLAVYPGRAPRVSPVHPNEAADLARIRGYRIRSGGRVYRIVRGDVHRHTDISDDGGGDGSLLDAYRYALDAAALDFLAITDHQAGHDREYPWWRTQKSADLFHVARHFVPLFGYERSLSYPNGHRNIVFAQRGVRTLPIGPDERQARLNSGPILFDHLRRFRGLSMPHTSATGMGTDWRDNAPDVEPLVEIYQGDRTSYEFEGAPLSASKERPDLQEGGFQPAGFVWNAWAKGYRLGVQASSDHLSTHLSYACILVTDLSREGLLDGMRRRHSYAATDNIVLDFRMRENGREFLMGDEFAARGTPRLSVKAWGTGPIRQIDVIRDNRVLYTAKPNTPAASFDYTDAAPTSGTSYYYVRVLQQDNQTAWSSPIWVRRG